jgi:hypothetical protein
MAPAAVVVIVAPVALLPAVGMTASIGRKEQVNEAERQYAQD